MNAGRDCTAGWCSTEPWCAIACAADLLGRKWHPVILSLLFEKDALGFSVIESEVDGLSDAVLSTSLDDLREKGIVERRVVSDRPLRVEYSLTERGASLEPVLDAMATWGREQLVAEG